MKNTMENIKTYVIITAIAIVGILGGCAVEKEDEGKVRDLEFTVVAQEEQPDALRDVIGEKKEKPFQISYTRGEELYIAVGYGEQESSGYSISVNELFETENTIVIDTTLIGTAGARTGSTGGILSLCGNKNRGDCRQDRRI